jgi:hypothetical protein
MQRSRRKTVKFCFMQGGPPRRGIWSQHVGSIPGVNIPPGADTPIADRNLEVTFARLTPGVAKQRFAARPWAGVGLGLVHPSAGS